MDGIELWDGGLGMGGEGGCGKVRGEILEMDTGGGWMDTKIFDKEGATAGKEQGGKEGVGV